MEKALAIANEFIQRGQRDGVSITQMKLQKLIFFAHGWYLAICNAPLVDEGFQAWKYGPVIPSVYHEFKAFGTLNIDRPGTTASYSPEGLLWETPVIADKTGTVYKLIDKIWEVYGHYTGTQLSAMTHQPDTPWSTVHNIHGDARDIPIPDDMIKKYFQGLIKNGN